MSQRKAAQATRKKFGLSTFSHTTLGRTFKELEASIAKAAAPPECNDGSANSTAQVEGGTDAAPSGQKGQKRRFPSVADTAERRKDMAAFIKSFLKGKECEDKEAVAMPEVSRRIVKTWYDKHKRLLI